LSVEGAQVPARGPRAAVPGAVPVAASAEVPLAPATAPADTPTRGRAHRRALLTLLGCTVLWSTAGVATRQLQQTEGYEVTFWRSLFCALCVVAAMVLRHRGRWLSQVVAVGWPGVVSGLMWAAMFTCFMIALSRTTVANVLVVMAAAPLLAALLGLVVLREAVLPRTWAAIAIAAAGIVWMAREGLSGDGIVGMAIAFAVPVASAINIVLLKRTGARVDLVPAVLLGAVFSCAIVLPLALPLSAGGRDLAILAGLGVFQLAVPCMLMVGATRYLAPHEIALVGLLEVVLGPLWAWLGAGERPAASTMLGGGMVLAALALNELAGLRARRA
jgi:drug/metabolite transporter (DMT)-like permease